MPFPFFCHKARTDKGRVQLSCQCSCRTGLKNCLALLQREQEEASFFPSLHWLRFLFKIFRERTQTPLNACYSWNIPFFSNTDTLTLNPQCTGVGGLRKGETTGTHYFPDFFLDFVKRTFTKSALSFLYFVTGMGQFSLVYWVKQKNL